MSILNLLIGVIKQNISPPPDPFNLMAIGDSQTEAITAYGVAAIKDLFFTPEEVTAGYAAYSTATGGHTIEQQIAAWNALPDKTLYDVVTIQLGLNNVALLQGTAAECVALVQGLVDQIKLEGKPGVKVVSCLMTPAYGRWLADAGGNPVGAAVKQDMWAAMNEGFATLDNVDGVVSSYVEAMSDEDFAILPEYESSANDGIHDNTICRAGVRIPAMRAVIFPLFE